MKLKRHLALGLGVVLLVTIAVWFTQGFLTAMFVTSTVLAQLISVDALLFIRQYAEVDWRASRWGRHVMRLCLLLGVTFQTVVIVNIFYALQHYNVFVVAGATVILYGAIWMEMHNRRHLERHAQEIKRESRNQK